MNVFAPVNISRYMETPQQNEGYCSLPGMVWFIILNWTIVHNKYVTIARDRYVYLV